MPLFLPAMPPKQRQRLLQIRALSLGFLIIMLKRHCSLGNLVGSLSGLYSACQAVLAAVPKSKRIKYGYLKTEQQVSFADNMLTLFCRNLLRWKLTLPLQAYARKTSGDASLELPLAIMTSGLIDDGLPCSGVKP